MLEAWDCRRRNGCGEALPLRRCVGSGRLRPRLQWIYRLVRDQRGCGVGSWLHHCWVRPCNSWCGGFPIRTSPRAHLWAPVEVCCHLHQCAVASRLAHCVLLSAAYHTLLDSWLQLLPMSTAGLAHVCRCDNAAVLALQHFMLFLQLAMYWFTQGPQSDAEDRVSAEQQHRPPHESMKWAHCESVKWAHCLKPGHKSCPTAIV
ncbi:hypothetical protein COO60DRAFT_164274 [Scenedesmus sp. NREL 46B-D3]|nr:hypothetical protein COO60DRAFT_164274 [Scenedesmus sp. NREL 46B-D3]